MTNQENQILELEVGMGATLSVGSDSYPYTVVAITGKKATDQLSLLVIITDLTKIMTLLMVVDKAINMKKMLKVKLSGFKKKIECIQIPTKLHM